MDQKSIQKSMGKSMQKKINFSMVLEFFGGAHHAAGISAGGLPDPLNQDFSRQTKHHWNWARARARARAMGLGKDRHKGLG